MKTVYFDVRVDLKDLKYKVEKEIIKEFTYPRIYKQAEIILNIILKEKIKEELDKNPINIKKIMGYNIKEATKEYLKEYNIFELVNSFKGKKK